MFEDDGESFVVIGNQFQVIAWSQIMSKLVRYLSGSLSIYWSAQNELRFFYMLK